MNSNQILFKTRLQLYSKRVKKDILMNLLRWLILGIFAVPIMLYTKDILVCSFFILLLTSSLIGMIITPLVEYKNTITTIELIDNYIHIEYLHYNEVKKFERIPLQNFKLVLKRGYSRASTERLGLLFFNGDKKFFTQKFLGEWDAAKIFELYIIYKKLKEQGFSVNEKRIIEDDEFQHKKKSFLLV